MENNNNLENKVVETEENMDPLLKSSKEVHPLSEKEQDDDDEVLDLNKAPEEETVLSHWPLLTALLILLVMLTHECGFKFQPAFPLNPIIIQLPFYWRVIMFWVWLLEKRNTLISLMNSF